MNTNPNPTYNIIKGLQIYINDIRSCTTKEAEHKRVEKELNKIREKFATGKALTGYEKKKCVWKLVYTYILGYAVDFGHNYAADLITSIKFSEKMTGYISMSILFKENNSEINIMINSIRNDLLHTNAFTQSMALTLATNINNPELLKAIAQDVIKFMVNFGEKPLYTVKKALICLIKIFKVKKEIYDASTWIKLLSKMVDMKHFEILLAVCSLILNIFKNFGTTGYEDIAMKLVNNVLDKMKKKECPEEYSYYSVKCPWLQVKILKIVQNLNPNLLDGVTLAHLKEYADHVAKKAHNVSNSREESKRFYAEYSIFFECVNLIDHLNLKIHHKTFDQYINILGFLLVDDRKHPNKDVNTKYLALDGIAKLSKYTSGNKIMKDHSTMIISSLRDNDISIRRRSLDLLFLCCTQDSVKMISKELILYLKEDEPQLKEDVSLKIAILAEKYAMDHTWYIDVCCKMLELAGDFVADDIIHRFVQIVVGFENQETNPQLQVYACEKLLKLLEKDYIYENVVRLASIILGEFGHYLNFSGVTSDDENPKSFNKQIELILKHISICSNTTIYSIFNCLMKFLTKDINVRNVVVPFFEQYLESWDTELQQRAIEYMILSKMDGENPNIPNMSEIRERLFEKMPVFNKEAFNNSVLMKRLQKTQTGIYLENKEKTNGMINSGNLSNVEYTLPSPNIDNVDKIITSCDFEKHAYTNPYSEHILFKKDPSGFAIGMNKHPDYAVPINKNIISKNSDLFKSLISNPVPFMGLVYSDENLKIQLKAKIIEGVYGTMALILLFSSGSGSKVEDISVQLNNYMTPELLDIKLSNPKYFDDVNEHSQVLIRCQINDTFSAPPHLSLSCRVGMMKINTTFALPILVTKFFNPSDISIETFVGYWYEYSNSPDSKYQKLDAIMTNPYADGTTIVEFLKKFGSLLSKLQFKLYPPHDRDNFHEIEGIATINTENIVIPILLQVTFIPSFNKEFRLSLRSLNSKEDRFTSLLLDVFSVIKFYLNN